MQGDIIFELGIEVFANSPLGKQLQSAAETVVRIQQHLAALIDYEDSDRLKALKIGTVFQIFLIDALCSGKKIDDLTADDWRGIAKKVSERAILEEGQTYSEFVFSLYADYIDISVSSISAYTSKDQQKAILSLSKEIRDAGKLLEKQKIAEAQYVEKCLWLSLEGMIKLLSADLYAALDSSLGKEYAELSQAVVQFSFEYARYSLYAKESAILDEYLQSQRILSEQLKAKYDAYLTELNERAAVFQELIDSAFSPGFHDALSRSATLARAAGADEKELIRTIDDVDSYFEE